MIKLESDISNESIINIANLSPAYVFDFENISNTVKTIISSGHRRIPVVSKNNNLVGILTYMDILDALLRGLTRNTQVSTFMTREVIFCESTEDIKFVLQKLKLSRRGGLPVVKNMKLIGMVSERDFIRILLNQYFDIPVGRVMTHKPFFITPNTSILNCMKTMVNTHYRRLPIVSGKEVIGIVTGLDVLQFINETNYNLTRLNENVESIMSTPVKYVTEHDDVSDAIRIMLENNIGGLPVINEENMLKGIITERDIIELI
ncbi:MAG: CBS domain-containing protein [Candidatus Aenigmatarchaeota archaeon]|nr:CBS domain-containing protein [Candidatus Aenigmarchaeota archaeon]